MSYLIAHFHYPPAQCVNLVSH